MAFWRKNEDEFSETKEIVKDNPGIKPGSLARHFNVSRSTITRRLPSMEEAGYLLYEDDDGGLWWFDPSEFDS